MKKVGGPYVCATQQEGQKGFLCTRYRLQAEETTLFLPEILALWKVKP